MTSAYWSLLILLIPIAAWAYCAVKHKEVSWQEAAVGVSSAAVVVTATLAIGGCVTNRSSETLSGAATAARHTPRWTAEWTELETTYDNDGNPQTRVVYRSHTHPARWWLDSQIGPVDIRESEFEELSSLHGRRSEKGDRPDYASGDRYDYYVLWEPVGDGMPRYPVHRTSFWRNPLLGSDSLLKGREVSEERATAAGLPSYPSSSGRTSGRVLGPSDVSTASWDRLCARLGPLCKVNLILVAMDSPDDATLLKDYWKNGRKNDLVLCYGKGPEGRASWSYVFGWSSRDMVKQVLQSVLLENPVDDTILPLVGMSVERYHTPFDWESLDYVDRPVHKGVVISAFLLVLVTQAAIMYVAHSR